METETEDRNVAAPVASGKHTTVHDRYQIGDALCGQVETTTSLARASAIAVAHAEAHAREPANTVTAIEVFDRMARTHCQDTWIFPVANAQSAYVGPAPVASGKPVITLIEAAAYNRPPLWRAEIANHAPIEFRVWDDGTTDCLGREAVACLRQEESARASGWRG